MSNHTDDLTPAASRVIERLLHRLDSLSILDPVAKPVSAAVRKIVPPGRLRDALHGVPLGHPAHPMLVQVPLGAWLSASALDLIPGTDRATLALTGLGTAAAAPAALAGIVDWSSIHGPQQRVGLIHWISNTVAVGCYAASFVQRLRGRNASGKALGFAGIAAASVGGYLGGHLAYRQSIGANHAERVPYLAPEGWHRVAELVDLEDRKTTVRMVGPVPVMLYRNSSRIWAIADECSHQAGPLHEGELVDRDGASPCVVCPWHGSTFSLEDGAVVHAPATSPQPTFDTRIHDGAVEVRLSS